MPAVNSDHASGARIGAARRLRPPVQHRRSVELRGARRSTSSGRPRSLHSSSKPERHEWRMNSSAVHLHGADVEPLRGIAQERPGGVRRGAGTYRARCRRVAGRTARPLQNEHRCAARSPPPTAGCAPPSPRSARPRDAARPVPARCAPSPPTASPAGPPAPASRPPSSTAARGGSSEGCCAEPGLHALLAQPPLALVACAPPRPLTTGRRPASRAGSFGT